MPAIALLQRCRPQCCALPRAARVRGYRRAVTLATNSPRSYCEQQFRDRDGLGCWCGETIRCNSNIVVVPVREQSSTSSRSGQFTFVQICLHACRLCRKLFYAVDLWKCCGTCKKETVFVETYIRFTINIPVYYSSNVHARTLRAQRASRFLHRTTCLPPRLEKRACPVPLPLRVAWGSFGCACDCACRESLVGSNQISPVSLAKQDFQYSFVTTARSSNLRIRYNKTLATRSLKQTQFTQS